MSGEAWELSPNCYKDVLRRVSDELARAKPPTQEARAPKEDNPAAKVSSSQEKGVAKGKETLEEERDQGRLKERSLRQRSPRDKYHRRHLWRKPHP